MNVNVQAEPILLTKTVTTAGTPVVLGTSATKFRVITFIAPKTNTGIVYVQFTSAVTAQRVPVEPDGIVPLAVPGGKFLSADQVYLDSTVNGEGVSAVGFN